MSEPQADRYLRATVWRLAREHPHDFYRASLARLGQVTLQRRDNAAVHQRRWIDASGQVAQRHERVSCLPLNFRQELRSRDQVAVHQFLQDPQVDRQGDQMLLRTVMQVALDAPTLGVLGSHDALAGGA